MGLLSKIKALFTKNKNSYDDLNYPFKQMVTTPEPVIVDNETFRDHVETPAPTPKPEKKKLVVKNQEKKPKKSVESKTVKAVKQKSKKANKN
jgi:hypothetical protein